jgi:hypothetical protein
MDNTGLNLNLWNCLLVIIVWQPTNLLFVRLLEVGGPLVVLLNQLAVFFNSSMDYWPKVSNI